MNYIDCACGCMEPVLQTNKYRPNRFILGHQNRLKDWGSVEERFWSKVDRRGEDECWPWTGANCGGWTGKPEDEAMVTQIQHAAIVSALKKQQTVIVSDTNLNRGIVKGLVKIAQNWGAKVSFVYFDTPMVECVIRDERRGERGERAVGEKVIRDMSRRYGNPNFDDLRMDAIVKYEIFDEKIRNNYNVLYAFDDRDQVVDLWRSINIPTFQVNYGAF